MATKRNPGDEDLRSLERKAKAGDADAAVRLVAALARSEPARLRTIHPLVRASGSTTPVRALVDAYQKQGWRRPTWALQQLGLRPDWHERLLEVADGENICRFRGTEYNRERNTHDRINLDEVTTDYSLRYGDFESLRESELKRFREDDYEFEPGGLRNLYVLPRLLSGSRDVDPDLALLSNHEVFGRDLREGIRPGVWTGLYGGYGTFAVAIRLSLGDEADTLEEKESFRGTPVEDGERTEEEEDRLTAITEVIETLERLEKYPVLDDDHYSQLRDEEEQNNWQSWGRADFKRALREAIPEMDEAIDDAEDGNIDAMFWQACQDIERYPETSDTETTFPIREVVEHITEVGLDRALSDAGVGPAPPEDDDEQEPQSNPKSPDRACDPSSKPLTNAVVGKKVRVHLNLHNGCYVVSQNGKVVGYTHGLQLRDVTAKVSDGGFRRCREEASRNVHAYLEGILVSHVEPAMTSRGRRISYNCLKKSEPCFYYADTQGCFKEAREARCYPRGQVWVL
jgi:hypothetical protein